MSLKAILFLAGFYAAMAVLIIILVSLVFAVYQYNEKRTCEDSGYRCVMTFVPLKEG